jgi:hypothetical protein
MRAHIESKLDRFQEQLDEWLTPRKDGGEGFTQLKVRKELLPKLGCSVSCSRLSDWWAARRSELGQAKMIEQIRTGSAATKKVAQEFAENPAPEIALVIKMIQVLVMKFSAQANVDPAQIEYLVALLKPVMDWVKIQEHGKDRDFAVNKWQWDAAKECLKKLPALKAIVQDKSLSEAGKVDAIRLKLFGVVAGKT